MKINASYINEYKKIIQTTNLQKGYQEFVTFFRGMRAYLAGRLPEYKFTGNIVENNMDYSYFQFSNEALQSKGLKFVIAFTHSTFVYEIWLSGMNRKTQGIYHEKLTKAQHAYTMSPNPNKFDYILKERLFDEVDYEDCEKLFATAQGNIEAFAENIAKMV